MGFSSCLLGSVEIDAFGSHHVEQIDLLRIARRAGGAAGAIEGALPPIDASRRPQQVRKRLQGQRLFADLAYGAPRPQGREDGLAAVAFGFGKANGLRDFQFWIPGSRKRWAILRGL